MNLGITTTQVFIGLIVAWCVTLYFYWRYIRDQHPEARNRAYDILFMTLFLCLILARGVVVLGNFNFYTHATDGLQFLYFWDLDINYLVLVFAPLLAYQFTSFNIEKNLHWKQDVSKFIAFGSVLVLLIELSQLIRGLVLIWPSTLIMYHTSMVALLALVAFAVTVKIKNVRLGLPIYAALIVLPAGIIIINMIFPALSTSELNITIASQITLAVITLIPFFSRPRKKTQIARPKPSDFRNL